jgi:hypothetical protein
LLGRSGFCSYATKYKLFFNKFLAIGVDKSYNILPAVKKLSTAVSGLLVIGGFEIF